MINLKNCVKTFDEERKLTVIMFDEMSLSTHLNYLKQINKGSIDLSDIFSSKN